MTHRPSRRAFLEARIAADTSMRPPGADASTFLDRCTRCGDCAAACEEAIIQPDANGFPVLNFRRECTFCGACANACQEDALEFTALHEWPWRAQVSAACFTHHGIDCRSCQDSCEPRAIRFRPQAGSVATPILSEDDCNGCGACASVCPASAITFTRIETTTREAVS